MRIQALVVIFTIFSSSFAEAILPKTFQHPSGYRVAIFENTRLPIVDLLWTIPSQSEWSPLLARLIERKLHALEQYGTLVRVDIDRDWTLIQIKSFSKNLSKLIGESEKILFQSSFTHQEIQSEIEKWSNSLDDEASHPDWVLQKMMFPNEVLPNFSWIRKKTEKDIQKLYLDEYQKQNTLLAIIGKTTDSDLSFLKPKVERLQFTLPKRKTKLASKHQIQTFPGIDQVHIRLASKASGANSANAEALWIANTILGGTPHSRLANHIRDELGLTFGVSSQLVFRNNESIWTIATSTRKELSERLAITLHRELQKLYQNGVSADEVSAAKKYLKGSFPVNLATPVGLASQWIFQNLLGVKEPGLDTLIERIDAVSPEQVNEVIKKQIHIKNWIWFILAPDDFWKSKLKTQLDRQLPSK